MRFNEYFKNHFAGCRVLANARDEHRGRDVKIFQVPGEFDFVGVSDGTDVWIAPTGINPFSVDVPRILADIRAGKEPPTVQPSMRRRLPPTLTNPLPAPARRPLPAELAPAAPLRRRFA